MTIDFSKPVYRIAACYQEGLGSFYGPYQTTEEAKKDCLNILEKDKESINLKKALVDKEVEDLFILQEFRTIGNYNDFFFPYSWKSILSYTKEEEWEVW